MKKILWLMITFFTSIVIYHAEVLNFRVNMLTFNSYKINNQEKIFVIYTNNLTEKIIYSLNPLYPPENLGHYKKEEDLWGQLEQGLQNKIKKAIWETQNASEFATQMYFYIHTQMLIWQSFHPEIPIYLGPEVGSFIGNLEKYHQLFLEKINQKPDWIKDYEIKDGLTLPNDPEYHMESQDCQLITKEDVIEILNCNPKSKITIKEKLEDTISFKVKEESTLIESGTSPRLWQIFLTQKEEESKPPTPPKEETSTPHISDNKNNEEIKPPLMELEPQEEPKNLPLNSVHILSNVPNTFEKNVMNPILFGFIILGFLCLKKQF
jgi:hypothetical protein